jgi:hypothetical protein
VEDLKRRADASKRAAYSALFRSGSDLDEKHMDALAATVVGDEIVDLVTRTTNLVTLLERLRDAVAKGTGGAEAQRRYYGAVVAVQKMALAAQRRYLERIEGRYGPFVDGIVRTAGKALEQATELRRSETNSGPAQGPGGQHQGPEADHGHRPPLQAPPRRASPAGADGDRGIGALLAGRREHPADGGDRARPSRHHHELGRAVQGDPAASAPVMQPFNSDEIERAFQNLTTQMNGF